MSKKQVGELLNDWIGKTSILHQERLAPSPCERFRFQEREKMMDMAHRSSVWDKEYGTPVVAKGKWYELGKEYFGTRTMVQIPRTEDTQGTYHTHPYGFARPSSMDLLDAFRFNDKVACIGASGYVSTRVNCFSPKEPEWSRYKERYERLQGEIDEWNKYLKEHYRDPKTGKALRGAALTMKLTPQDDDKDARLGIQKRELMDELETSFSEMKEPVQGCLIGYKGPEKIPEEELIRRL